MSREQMRKARDADIASLFAELTDDTHSTHPRDPLRGGSEQAFREFGAMAAENPDRAVSLIGGFHPGRNERPVGEGLVGLAKSPYPDADLFQLILSLEGRGFASEDFRVNAARALEARLKEGEGLPESMTDLLERWLAAPWSSPGGSAHEREAKQSANPVSVLWHGAGAIVIPCGQYQLLHTITYGYLLRRPPATGRWLAALEAHLERPSDLATWQVLSREFKFLVHCEPGGRSRFLSHLIERFPGVLQGALGAAMLTHVWWFLPADEVWAYLDRLRRGDWPLARQAFGELVALRAFVFSEDERAQREFRSLVGDTQGADSGPTAERVGVAFACAHMWGDSTARSLATEGLVQLIPGAGERLAQALLTVFRATDQLLPDQWTHQLLTTIADNPGVLTWLEEGWLLERLSNLMPYEPESIFRICREIVRLRGAEAGSLSSGWALHAAHLTSIAVTLHRMGRENRDHGLELFEGLLAVRLPDAETALLEIDQRLPAATTGYLPPPRRPRRRRKQTG